MQEKAIKRKIGTVVDEELLRRAKLAAAAQGITLSKVLEDALRDYLDRRSGTMARGVVASTWGAIPVDPALLRAVLEEESALEA